MLGPAVRGEVEHGALEVGRQIQIAIAGDDFIFFGQALGGDLAGGGDDERMAMRKPSSKPHLPDSTSQVAFWKAMACAMMR